MQFHATLNYTEDLIARAVLLYWRRTVGIGLVAMVGLIICLLAWRLADGDRSWIVGLLMAVTILGVAMPLAVYVVHYRNSMSKFRAMARPTAVFTADDEGFTISSDEGTATLKWSAVAEVWRSEQLWLILFSKSRFSTLPLEGVPEQMQAFVIDRIRASGGRISG